MEHIQKRRSSKHELRNKMHEVLDEATEQISGESKSEKMLLRNIRAEALSRIERSAKTIAEFEIIINAWDLIESNIRKKDEKYTVSLSSFKLDSNTEDFAEIDMIACTDTVFPIPYYSTLRSRYWRQIISGDFLDYICDCAYEMHGSVTSKAVCKAIEQLTDNQKEIFYMIAVEGRAAKQIAAYRNQTTRNVHKVYNCAIESMHKYLGIEVKSNRKNKSKGYKKGGSEK